MFSLPNDFPRWFKMKRPINSQISAPYKSSRLVDKTRKELHKAFEQFGLKITAESNLHVVNFLDVTFDLSTGNINHTGSPMTIRYT